MNSVIWFWRLWSVTNDRKIDKEPITLFMSNQYFTEKLVASLTMCESWNIGSLRHFFQYFQSDDFDPLPKVANIMQTNDTVLECQKISTRRLVGLYSCAQAWLSAKRFNRYHSLQKTNLFLLRKTISNARGRRIRANISRSSSLHSEPVQKMNFSCIHNFFLQNWCPVHFDTYPQQYFFC